MSNPNRDDESFSVAVSLAGGAVLPMVVKAAIELGLFEIMAAEEASGGSNLSATEMASRLPTKNPEAASMIERMLCYLASHSVLAYSVVQDENGNSTRAYGLTSMCKHFVPDVYGVSLAPQLLFVHDKVNLASWDNLKDAILDGGLPFNKVHGMHAFEYTGKDTRFSDVVNQAMRIQTHITMNNMLEVYKGFEGISEIVDVGGGFGASVAAIVSKYPQIKGINFDLPHVIQNSPIHQGVVNIEGDMFKEIPKAEALYLKYILHDWSDNRCVQLLRNCWKALPRFGKVIVVESLLPKNPESDFISRQIFSIDVRMMNFTRGGKERTKKQLDALAKEAGFSLEVICHVPHDKVWVMEFKKIA